MGKFNLNEGNESLNRILLMMKYDEKKTLSENIQEQTMSPDYDVAIIKNELDATFSTDEEEIVSILKKYKTKEDFNNLLKKYKELVGKDLGVHFGMSFTKNRDKTEWDDLSNHLKGLGIEMVQDFKNGRISGTVFKGTEGNEGTTDTKGKNQTKGKYKFCSSTYKPYCYNKNVIGKVQGCLGLKQDGYFGPKTQSALKSVGFGKGFTDNDVNKICQKSKKPNTQVRPKAKTVSTIKSRGVQQSNQSNQPSQSNQMPSPTNEDVTTRDISDASIDVKLDGQKCKSILRDYVVSALQHQAGVESSVRSNYREMKRDIVKCAGAGEFDNFQGFTQNELGAKVTKRLQPFGFLKGGKRLSWKEIVKMLNGRNKRLLGPNPKKNRPSSPYLIPKLEESNNNNMDKIIKENLIRIRKEKQNILTEETNILRNRINILTEGKNFKNKRHIDKFANDLIQEVFTLRSQGFDEEVLNEGLLDMLTGLFGKGTSSIFEVIKEKLVAWIIKKLGFSTDSLFADIIIVGFGNVDFKDYNKLFDCKYLSDLIVNSIAEGIAKNMSDNRSRGGESSVFMDLLRNIVAEMFKDSSFENKLSGGLEAILCPLMGGVKNKMEDAAEDIKSKVVDD